MKTVISASILLLLTFTVTAQDQNKKKVSSLPSKAQTDFLLEINGVDGDSGPDSIPPATKGNFFIGAGLLMSQTSNSNLVKRFNVSAKTGFVVNGGYAFIFRKSKLQVNASYSEGGVNIAVGDVNGDGVGEKETATPRYISIPVQYHHYIGNRNILSLGGGAFAGLLLPAVQKLRAYNEGFEKLDAGLIFSAGIRLSPRLNIQASYQLGLMDIDPSTSNSAKNGVSFIMLNYSIGPIIKIKPKGGAQTSGAPKPSAKLSMRKAGGTE